MTSSPDAGAFARLRAAASARLQALLAARLRLHANWRELLRHAWSVRLSLLATLLSGLEVAIGVLASDPPIPRGTFAAVALVVTLAAGGARLVAQKSVSSGGDA